jgi:hypothetical protein
MSGVIARRVASTPVRSAAQTWAKITELLAPDPNSPARKDLAAAAGVACSSISSEATGDAAIIVWGNGPRVRVYSVFNEDAITGDGVNEDSLPKTPTEGDWKMSIPCLPEDVQWSGASLAAASERITARSMDEDVDDDDKDKADSGAAKSAVGINLAEFMKS